ncbi:MAG: replication-associated recombination protein A [Eubacteriales bacterium]|nr:replication-associated recombination protein A [Clostridiales bacterium]MDY3942252.1 replication-associated recombination protein A [Eubacteriales bacterium]
MTSSYTPLAEKVRPLTFDDMVGQTHLCGKNGILRRIAAGGKLPSMIFFGPPGCGKTTAAGILANASGMQMHRLNATTASLSDIRDVTKETEGLLGQNGILLYLDEIQYFNKKQQQSLLEYLEDGRITLIASTTENPYYYIYDALLSRCSVFEFHHVTAADILARLQRVAAERYPQLTFADGVLAKLADASGGDVRRGLTLLEVASRLGEEADGGSVVALEAVDALVPEGYLSNFDRDGDVHYDLLSCLQKSIRGSDPDAAVFYLAKLLESGDLISPCRRLLVIASEDIGPAYPMAAVIVRACVESARELGLPEARLPLANAAVILATAPKSNSAHDAINAAIEDIHKGLGSDIPTHLRSPQFRGYKYPHDYPDHYVKQDYLPADLRGRRYYEFGENKTEQAARAYWQKIKGEDV